MLTLKQRQIIELLGEGYTSKQIASTLFISYWTVKDHIEYMLNKFDCSNRTHLVKYAHENNLLPEKKEV